MHKKIAVLLIVFMLLSAFLISCEEIPVETDASSKQSSSITESLTVSDTQSADESFDESSEEPSEESSEESSEVSDIPLDLPYKNLGNLESYDITPSELDSYFENSVLIGNSIMRGFYDYVTIKRSTDKGFLSNSKIIYKSAYAPSHEFPPSFKEENLMKYQGEYMHLWDAIKESGANTVYFSLLALNELGLHATETCAEDAWATTLKVIDKIKETVPDIKIVILSNTYQLSTFHYKRLNNDNIFKLNELALSWCNENGVDFIDISSPLNQNGSLREDVCADPNGNGCHITLKGYNVWVAALRNYAYTCQNGTYKNPEVAPR